MDVLNEMNNSAFRRVETPRAEGVRRRERSKNTAINPINNDLIDFNVTRETTLVNEG